MFLLTLTLILGGSDMDAAANQSSPYQFVADDAPLRLGRSRPKDTEKKSSPSSPPKYKRDSVPPKKEVTPTVEDEMAKPIPLFPDEDQGRPGVICRFEKLGWGIKSLAFSPNGRFLAVGKADDMVMMMDIPAKSVVYRSDRLDRIGSIAAIDYSPDGKFVIAGGYRGLIEVYSVSSAGQLTSFGQFAGHVNEIKALTISPDSKYVLSGDSKGNAKYWEINSGQELAQIEVSTDAVKACRFSPDGKTGLASDGARVLIYNLGKNPTLAAQRIFGDRGILSQSADFTHDGKQLAVGDGYAIIRRQISDSTTVSNYDAGEIQWSMRFTPDSKRLLSGGSSEVNIWDMTNGRRIYSQSIGDYGTVHALAVSSDARMGAASCTLGEIVVFRLPPQSK